MKAPSAAVTAWSAISPFGYGRAAFAEGLRTGRAAFEVPDFVIAQRLGAKGTGSMDRSSALAVATLDHLIRQERARTGPGTGVVLGTTSGSTRTQFAFTRESLVRRKPYFVNPAMMPFALMNSAAAQCAIAQGLTGPNTTVANGRMAGLAALRYAARLLAAGRAGGVVCGAVEEASAERALLASDDRALGEGCALVLLEPPGAPGALAELVAVDTRLALAEPPERALGRSLRAVLGSAAVPPASVTAFALASDGVEGAAVTEVCGAGQVVVPARLTGDTGAATGMFQLAALLCLPEPAEWAVLTGTDQNLTVGCALFRLLTTGSAG